jgi:hypothetical protein
MLAFPGSDQYMAELKHAESARRDGNEGKARVCARRAAGILIGEYLRMHGLNITETSAYERLKILQSLPGVSKEVQSVLSHFLIRINPDKNLPENVDLIADTYWLERTLLVMDQNSP